MDTLYEVASRVVLSGWAALVLALFATQARKPLFLYAGLILPGAISIAYVAALALFFANPPPEMGDLSTLPGYKSVLTEDSAAAATWLHLLAFDLFVGTWAVRDGLESNIGRAWLVLVLAMVLVAGPAGLLFYLLLKTGHAIRAQSRDSTQRKTA